MDIPVARAINWLRLIPFVLAGIVVMIIFDSTKILGDGAFDGFNPIVGMLIVLLYYFVMQRVVKGYGYKGLRLVKREQFAEAVEVYSTAALFFERHPFLDKWRSFLFFDCGKYGLRECALVNTAFCYTQMGKRAEAESYYKRGLQINAKNGAALAALRFLSASKTDTAPAASD